MSSTGLIRYVRSHIAERCPDGGDADHDMLNDLADALNDLADALEAAEEDNAARSASARASASASAEPLAELERAGLNNSGRRPLVVCLCGSTRFADVFARENLRLTLEGVIVLSIGANVSDASLGIAQDSETKARLDDLHLRKIDMADEVFVVNVGGYIGESTRREIAYAASHRKPVRYLEGHDAAAD